MKVTLRKIVLWFKGLRRLWVLTTVEDNLNSLVFQVKDNKKYIKILKKAHNPVLADRVRALEAERDIKYSMAESLELDEDKLCDGCKALLIENVGGCTFQECEICYNNGINYCIETIKELNHVQWNEDDIINLFKTKLKGKVGK